MGNQGHAGDGCRTLKEWVKAGVLGDVTEVHSWTDRPIWPQGVKPLDHSKMMPVVPPTLDWDLWLGVAAEREYDPAYLPFTWRGFWDFGTGALGDMGCHILDGAYYALELGRPTQCHGRQRAPDRDQPADGVGRRPTTSRRGARCQPSS